MVLGRAEQLEQRLSAIDERGFERSSRWIRWSNDPLTWPFHLRVAKNMLWTNFGWNIDSLKFQLIKTKIIIKFDYVNSK